MGIGSKLKKLGRKLDPTKLLKKSWKAIKKVGSEVANGLRKVGREVKRFAKSDLGKVVIAAALVYAGGAAYLAANSGGAMSFGQALMSPGQVIGQIGGAGAAAEGGASTAAQAGTVETTLAGADSAAAVGSTASSAGAGSTAGAVGTTAPAATQASTISNLGGAIEAGGSQWAAGGAGGGSGILSGASQAASIVPEIQLASTAGGAVTGGGWLSNPLVQYGALQMGGNAIASMGQPSEEDLLEKQYELREAERQALIDGNVVAPIDPSATAGFRYDPVAGKESAVNPRATGPGTALQPDRAIRNQYTTEGLLRQGMA